MRMRTNSPSLSVTNVHAPQAGNYTVVITNSGGSITSAVAVLTVILPAPASLTQASRSPGGVFQMTLTGRTARATKSNRTLT